MNEVQSLIDKCRQRGTVSLRSLWPGRGKIPTQTRAKVKTLFGSSQTVTEEVDGETKVITINYDSQKGVYCLN